MSTSPLPESETPYRSSKLVLWPGGARIACPRWFARTGCLLLWGLISRPAACCWSRGDLDGSQETRTADRLDAN